MPPPLIQLEIITPRGAALNTAARLVELPGLEGRLGVMAGHQPGAVALASGTVRVLHADDRSEEWSTGSGFATVTPELVTLLVQSAARLAEPARREN
jgi:F-type H+-transporting ATPase subunit epsilon